jgi:hypothetical protein
MIGTEVQRAIFDALKVVVPGARVYDNVPADAVFPYVTIGDEQTLDAGNACGDGWETYADVDVWSRANSGFDEVKELTATVVTALAGIAEIQGHDLIAVEVESTRTFRDPDGKTSHSAISVKFTINPA